MGQDPERTIIDPCPITTLRRKLPDRLAAALWFWAVSKDASYTAQQQITALLRDRHRIRSEQER